MLRHSIHFSHKIIVKKITPIIKHHFLSAMLCFVQKSKPVSVEWDGGGRSNFGKRSSAAIAPLIFRPPSLVALCRPSSISLSARTTISFDPLQGKLRANFCSFQGAQSRLNYSIKFDIEPLNIDLDKTYKLRRFAIRHLIAPVNTLASSTSRSKKSSSLTFNEQFRTTYNNNYQIQ